MGTDPQHDDLQHDDPQHPGVSGAEHPPPSRADLERRVHVDLPRVPPEDMRTTHAVDPPPDPHGGKDTETEFMLRYAGW